jgi:glucose/arabinose dehydrogenase
MRVSSGAVIRFFGLLLIIGLFVGRAIDAASVPSGFTEKLIANGLASPTAMQFAPDGRLFVAEQGGRLRVIKNGTLLPTPFLTVTVNASGERGLLGVAFDPDFAANQFVYIYYTATTPALHNRISRFVANGDVAVAQSETIIFELNNLSGATNHNGGAIAFGPDGKLYAAVGDNANGANAQSFNTLHGKMLRINKDGTIPADNPFVTSASGNNRAIWALGLRNPFTFAFHRDGRIFINDVGQNTWEEINNGVAGANYGWPTTEGPTTDPRFIGPLYAYNHSSGGCAITGGAFYDALTWQFPSDYLNDYFFADFCGGWIRKLDPDSGGVTTFATGLSFPVDLKVADDGSLYYLARGSGSNTGSVSQISFGNAPPSITQHPQSRTVNTGASVTFTVQASGTGTLRYQWQRNDAEISGATADSYTIPAVGAADNGARFKVVVSNDYGSVTSNEATLTVSPNQSPVATITQPSVGSTYAGGNVIAYAGNGNDPEDGAVPASAFTWWVDFHHDTHTHPHMPPTSGTTSGSFTIPTTGETSANVWYRLHLSIRDSAGATHAVYRDVVPRKARLTLASNPAGLQLTLDGQPVTAPYSFDSVVGIVRNIAAVTPQSLGSTSYEFVSWSDGGAAAHAVATPSSPTTYTATYRAITSSPGSGLTAEYYDALNFSGALVTRVDPTINFGWSTGAPMPTMGVDTFTVRWTGQVMPQYTETYRFYTVSDDGVRLWVNGQQIVNNWTDHATTENSGTIALTAGQRYDVRMEFFENTGHAVARLLWSSPSTPKAVIPTARLFPASPPSAATIRVNFQTPTAPVPAGYMADTGAVFGPRGNGYSYGWIADNTQYGRDRNAPNSSDQRYDTLTHMQWPSNSRNATWEIAVPNGAYTVRIVAGDPSYYDSVHRIAAEGVLVANGTPSSAARWVEGTATVTVADGRLTIGNHAGATNNKICFVEITPR